MSVDESLPMPPRRKPGRLPRFVRRHGHKVVNVEWTVRPVFPGRRERKIAARIGRLMHRRGIV